MGVASIAILCASLEVTGVHAVFCLLATAGILPSLFNAYREPSILMTLFVSAFGSSVFAAPVLVAYLLHHFGDLPVLQVDAQTGMENKTTIRQRFPRVPKMLPMLTLEAVRLLGPMNGAYLTTYLLKSDSPAEVPVLANKYILLATLVSRALEFFVVKMMRAVKKRSGTIAMGSDEDSPGVGWV